MDHESAGWQPELPGLTPPKNDNAALVKAAVATVAALEADGLLEPRHALAVQSILTLAEQIGQQSTGKFTVAIGNGWRTLLDAIAALPVPESSVSGDWDELAKRFAEADVAARNGAPRIPGAL